MIFMMASESRWGWVNLRRRIDRELELWLFAVVYGQSLHEQGREAWSSSASEGVEDQESLKSVADVNDLANAIQHDIHEFLA